MKNTYNIQLKQKITYLHVSLTTSKLILRSAECSCCSWFVCRVLRAVVVSATFSAGILVPTLVQLGVLLTARRLPIVHFAADDHSRQFGRHNLISGARRPAARPRRFTACALPAITSSSAPNYAWFHLS